MRIDRLVIPCLLVVATLAFAGPEPKPRSGCIDRLIRFTGNTATFTTVGAAGVAFHLAGRLGADHGDSYVTPGFLACFAYDESNGHHFQWTCKDTFVEMSAIISGQVNAADRDIAMGFAHKATSGTMSASDFIRKVARTHKATGDYVQHRLRLWNYELQENEWYAILIASENGGSPGFTAILSQHWEIQEMGCRQ